GTRMKSAPEFAIPKVMRGFAGRSLIGHVLAATTPLAATPTVVVVGHLRDVLIEHLQRTAPAIDTVVQERQDGTGHAVRVALGAVDPDRPGIVVVAPGDTPLLEPASLADLVETH